MSSETSNKSIFTVKEMTFTAIFSALIAICSWISIPTTVPFTMQTFAVFCALSVLGGKRGFFSILIYIILGLIGVPVFAHFSAGPSVLFGMTGGYIIGFLFTAVIYWIFEKISKDNLIISIISLVIGLAVCYAFGTAWFMVVYTRSSGAIGLASALGMCVIPFIIPDIIKLAVAVIISGKLKKYAAL